MGVPKGFKHTEESKRRMSVAQKKTYENGKVPFFKGKHLSEETRHKLSEAHKGIPSPLKGKKKSPEQIEAVRQGLLKYWQTHDHPYKGRRVPKSTLEKQIQGRLDFYRNHNVWNKGRPWLSEIRERIREGCLNSAIGMGPKPVRGVSCFLSAESIRFTKL